MDGTGNKITINDIKKYTPVGYCDSDDIIVSYAQGSYFTDINQKTYLDFTSQIALGIVIPL